MGGNLGTLELQCRFNNERLGRFTILIEKSGSVTVAAALVLAKGSQNHRELLRHLACCIVIQVCDISLSLNFCF